MPRFTPEEARALVEKHGTIAAAARILGCSWTTVWRSVDREAGQRHREAERLFRLKHPELVRDRDRARWSPERSDRQRERRAQIPLDPAYDTKRATTVDFLRKLSAQIDGTPTRRMWDADPDRPFTAAAATMYFGSWRNAQRAAGLSPNGHGPRPTQKAQRPRKNRVMVTGLSHGDGHPGTVKHYGEKVTF